jgi:hypothetical protein
MASTILIHIGTPKTGTSSIQRALSEADATGAIRPVCVPTASGRIDRSVLASLYGSYDRLPRFVRSRYAPDDPRLAEIQRECRRGLLEALRGSDAAVLSSELLAPLAVDEIERLRSELVEAGASTFHIVLYVRDPADYYLSWTQQRLKASHRPMDPVEFRYPFRDFTVAWEQCFPGRVIVRRFARDPDFDVVGDFSGVLEEHLGVSLPPIPSRQNESLSAEGMEILQRYRSAFLADQDHVFVEETNRLLHFLAGSSELLAQTRPELRPEIASWIRFHHRDDVAYLRDRYGVDLAEEGGGEPTLTNPPAAPADGFWRVADLVTRVDDEVALSLLLHYVRQLTRPAGAGGST